MHKYHYRLLNICINTIIGYSIYALYNCLKSDMQLCYRWNIPKTSCDFLQYIFDIRRISGYPHSKIIRKILGCVNIFSEKLLCNTYCFSVQNYDSIIHSSFRKVSYQDLLISIFCRRRGKKKQWLSYKFFFVYRMHRI